MKSFATVTMPAALPWPLHNGLEAATRALFYLEGLWRRRTHLILSGAHGRMLFAIVLIAFGVIVVIGLFVFGRNTAASRLRCARVWDDPQFNVLG